MWENKILAVTGGCGFIGSHLCHALAASGARVRILDDLSTGDRARAPDGVDIIVGDVSDPAAVQELVDGVDGVFHLAAIASVERCNEAWLKSHRTNLGGTITVFEAVRAAASPPVPVIWASSAAIYGPSKVLPITEDTPTDPISPYGADKLGSELHASVAADLFGVPNIALRFFNVFGKGQDPRSPYAGVISIFADRLAKGLPITIHGDGEQTRDFVYVGDVITALIAGMKVRLGDRKSGRPARFDALNVCTGRAVSLNLLVETLQGLINDAGTSVNNGPARSGDIRHSLGDPTKMNQILNVRASTPLDVGLRALLDV